MYERINEKFDQIDNIEEYLKEKLEYEEWDKFQEPMSMYKKREITQKQLIKHGRKDIGNNFVNLFVKSKTQGVTTGDASATPSKIEKKKAKSKTKEVAGSELSL